MIWCEAQRRKQIDSKPHTHNFPKAGGAHWSGAIKTMSGSGGLDMKQGMIKTVFDAKTGELLGAHMVGAEVTELIQGYIVGRQLETTEEDLMNTVFPHPTLSEMMHESVLDAYDRVIHM